MARSKKRNSFCKARRTKSKCGSDPMCSWRKRRGRSKGYGCVNRRNVSKKAIYQGPRLKFDY